MNTRQNNLPLSLLTMAIFGLSACSGDDRGRHANESTPAAPSVASPGEAANDASAASDAAVPLDATADAQATMPAQDGMSEDEALGVLNAINEHEISAGEQALQKGVEGGVADYARMMIEEHGRNREQTTALGADAGSPQAQQQTEKGQRQLAELGALEGDAYRQGYIQAMVAGHTDALASLDERLIPAATSEDARAHLRTTREHVARHLELARDLQRGQ